MIRRFKLFQNSSWGWRLWRAHYFIRLHGHCHMFTIWSSWQYMATKWGGFITSSVETSLTCERRAEFWRWVPVEAWLDAFWDWSKSLVRIGCACAASVENAPRHVGYLMWHQRPLEVSVSYRNKQFCNIIINCRDCYYDYSVVSVSTETSLLW